MEKQKNKWYCRLAPSLGGGFEGTPESAWGTMPYDATKHINENVVFFGIYGLPDFYSVWRHKGRKACLWAGSDIRHLTNGYWLDDRGNIKIPSNEIAEWFDKNCENWVENAPEHQALWSLGIEAEICPSYLGDVNAMKPSYKPGNKFYASVSGNDFELYGWSEIDELAGLHPELEFHLYGNTTPFLSENHNFITHGRVSKEQMNKEIADMQGAIRMIPMEGFSELIAKSVLMEQWPISIIPYPHTILPEDIGKVPITPNVEGREYYRKVLNSYPWNNNKQVFYE